MVEWVEFADQLVATVIAERRMELSLFQEASLRASVPSSGPLPADVEPHRPSLHRDRPQCIYMT